MNRIDFLPSFRYDACGGYYDEYWTFSGRFLTFSIMVVYWEVVAND